ncbi:MAG: dienelactone hydrolase family protein [Pseudomonadaceae bacterium]|nr:dienelactone hydrolase family protein [Pseudomonadaceae bacterium]
MIEGFSERPFTAPIDGRDFTRPVFEAGEGPPVIVIQELPGIGPQTIELARLLREAGFQAILPHLFGKLGEVSLLGNFVRVLCMRREFHLFAKNASSPISQWLRALCADVRERSGAPGVGTIGMCLTGNFAISLLADDNVLAGVASQPSMPLGKHADLHMYEADIVRVRERLDELPPARAFRFDGDKICQAAKFDALERTFNQGRERIILETLPGGGHSVLTLDFVDDAGHPTRVALDNIISYLHDALAV